MPFCGVSEAFGMGAAQVKLPSNKVTFLVQDVLPGLTRDQFEDACMEGWKRWARVIGIAVDKHPNHKTDAVQIVTVANMGGPQGVLADQQLPYGSGINLRMRIDSTEHWVVSDNPAPGKINLLAVLCHEDGHCLGMQHILADGDADLMNASYNSKIYIPQEDDIGYGRKLYGGPLQVTPLPPPDSMPAEFKTAIDIELNGVKYRASGKFKRVG